MRDWNSVGRQALTFFEHDEDTAYEGYEAEERYAVMNPRFPNEAEMPYTKELILHTLRVLPYSEKAEASLKAEGEWLSYLKEREFPANRRVSAADGRDMVRFTAEDGCDYLAVSEESVVGYPVLETDFNNDIMEAYGETLGRLHRLSKEFQPKETATDITDILAEIDGILKNDASVPEETKEDFFQLRMQIMSLKKDEDTFGLIHGNPSCGRAFFDENAGFCHLTGFGKMMLGWYAYDVMTICEELIQMMDEDTYITARKAFLKGYRKYSRFALPDAALMSAMKDVSEYIAYAEYLKSVREEEE